MSILLAAALTACGSKSDGDGNQPSGSGDAQQEAGTEEPEDVQEPEESQNEQGEGSDAQDAAGDKKTLVVYYSASGNTKTIAGYLAKAAGADLFELVPEEPYSDADLDWTDEESRVVKEHDNEDERAVALEQETPPDWDSYDMVFVGYPIWWGIAAWPVDGFIAANDFTGKTVIPFCTSSSSGLSESGKLLEEAAGSGDWLEGMRFASRASEEDVKEWFEGLGL